MAFEKGVKIACGTDAGVPGNPHGTSARELSLYVQHLGMTPSQALQSATIIAAEAIKQQDTLGSLDIGKEADLVIVKSNPINDIRFLEDLDNIVSVYRSGIRMVDLGKIVLS